MLVLSRFDGQRIFIGDDIVITVLHTKHGIVRLGIEAPPDTPVHRQEIYERVQRENCNR